jgi:small subunit ribosomal protein S5
MVMEALGIKDVLAKSFGASNRMNVVKATLNALAQLRSLGQVAKLRGKTPEQIMKGSNV